MLAYFDLENAILENPTEWINIFASHIDKLSNRSPKIAELILRHGDPVAILRLEGTEKYLGVGQDYRNMVLKAISANGIWYAEESSPILQGYTTHAPDPTDGSELANLRFLNDTRLIAYAASYNLPTYMLLYGTEQSAAKKLLTSATRQRTFRRHTYSFFDSGRQIYINQGTVIGKYLPVIG